MAAITIRQLDEDTKSRLRLRAASHGRSMEEEAREILRSAVAAPRPRNLAQAIHARFKEFGGIDLQLPPRTPMRDLPALNEKSE